MNDSATNFLDEWYENVRLFKWRRGLISHPQFVHLDEIYREVKEFFPSEDFVKGSIDVNNWFAHIVANKKMFSIDILSETAELIRYYNSLQDRASLNIRTNLNKINYRGLNEKLLEVYVGYILNKAGLSPIIGESYLSKEGNKKQIDILLNIEGINYNVEVTKFYDSFAESLIDIALDITRFLEKRIGENGIRLDSVFTGYIGFKESHISLAGMAKEELKQLFKEHFHSFKANTKVIRPIPVVIHPKYEILIRPAYSAKDDEYDEKIKEFPFHIIFHMGPFASAGKIHYTIKGNLSGDAIHKNILLQEKVKEKIRQHREFNGKKLIVIGVDNIVSTHSKGNIPPIRNEDIDLKAMDSILGNDNLLLLIFKTATEDKQVTDLRLIGRLKYHQEIMQYLKKLSFDVRYN